MSVTKAQRVGIWIIVVFMVVGTIGSFAIIVLANANGQREQARINELSTKYQEDTKVYQAKVDAQAKELSTRYFNTFNQFSSRVSVFDAHSITTLTTVDLLEGTGDTLTAQSTFSAYYIGWTPDGNIFDSSIKDGSLVSPISASPGGVIKGWTDGVVGMKVGGVRELSIPSDLAYGEKGSGDKIPANTPLKFVIMVIPTPETIPQPEVPTELMNYYTSGGR